MFFYARLILDLFKTDGAQMQRFKPASRLGIAKN